MQIITDPRTVICCNHDATCDVIRIYIPALVPSRRPQLHPFGTSHSYIQHHLPIPQDRPFCLQFSHIWASSHEQSLHVCIRIAGKLWSAFFLLLGLNSQYPSSLPLKLALGHLPGSTAAALIGLLAGQIYRSDLANLKGYRIPPWLASFASQYTLPLLGSLRPARRSNRALPDEVDPDNTARPQNDEVITTARRTPAPSSTSTTQRINPAESNPADQRTGTGGSVVREWVEGLTGRGQQTGIRIPTEAEITQLTTMFPDIQRNVLVGTLQRRYVCYLLF